MSDTTPPPRAIEPRESAFNPDRLDRRSWISTLALAPLTDLDALWDGLADKPSFLWLKAPQRGAAMVRARAGGTGQKFNLGEMTITRCVVQLSTGEAGVAYVAGRSCRHAALAAVFDALLQREDEMDGPIRRGVERLAREIAKRRRRVANEVAASKVDFAMLVQEAGR
ncbi:alpha-D-ribose 1-methylphosphonate 5-triphosphate synthase subunit PhnG [Angulomicrobium tetraedrale]|uniref:Alpha-D-ribose 1-methylphosphonate 5-triphosphate synthase subunit PhnG n=1 Tax=Ancylobacter tetraedralis TaxID=217068 RepID=A0A839Z820_9HYPH|nr:alpha-D-ribose 1-methylphosphonate 5-triphosphate synthase subunit PhnG [Ancylobacter tetraedralis]